MKAISAALAAGLLAAGCTTETVGPAGTRDPARARQQLTTPREQAAEQTVLRYLQHLAKWETDPAYRLLCRMEQDKYESLEKYEKGLEQDRATVVRMASQAKIVSSGEHPDQPYVLVVVDLGEGRIEPFRTVLERGEWRVILPDERLRRQAGP